MANRLAGEISPYLRQHADDPVHWYPWGEEAFAAAREQGKPVLLSAGYAACHWCHVMARESFRDPAVAALLNESFVCVKVDREERPDVDDYYMTAVQALTGRGGWPLTVFLTPSGEPFHGGTYFPPEDRLGMPSFTRLLRAVLDAWRERREAVEEAAASLAAQIARLGGRVAAADELGLPAVGGDGAREAVEEATAQAVEALLAQEDRVHGGFGDPRGGPKFPPHAALALLMGVSDERGVQAALRALDAMAVGGLHDHLGGGFFRYAVDPAWRVPHFEKMLYDNALLLGAYARAFGATGEERYRQAALGVVGWLEREMATRPAPGQVAFFSALDADSEGEEGRFYAWAEPEFREALGGGELADLMARRYGVTASGGFEGGNVLRLAAAVGSLARETGSSEEDLAAELRRGDELLRNRREARVRPATDDKVLTSWNGLLLSALAAAGTHLGEPRLHDLGLELARFLVERRDARGELTHAWREGEARVTGLLEDHAYLGCGLLDLYLATLRPELLAHALRLAREVEERFADPEGGGWFDAAAWAGGAPARLKSHADGATPSRYAAAARLVWWAGRYLSDHGMQERALEALWPLLPAAASAPQAFATTLAALREMTGDAREVVVVGERDRPEVAAALAAIREAGRGDEALLLLDPADEAGDGHPLAGLGLAEGRYPPSAPLTVYVCRGGTCDLPLHDPAAVERAMLAA
ncbi:MAG TPA: thioredoxin domain-containing protein [Trueperaceae bacterium]|nr:thioredoxin domain-containing protein [Trueperaceae bacterium]